MWTSAVLPSLSVTSMPIVRTPVNPIGVHVKLDLLEMEKHVPVREYNDNEFFVKFGWHSG